MDTVNPTEKPKRPRYESYACSEGCPVEAALEQIGGKWKGVALYHLLDATVRFNELKRQMGTVTQRMLTKQLRELEADGMVKRKVYAVVPPKVEYSLTAKGQSLRPIILALKAWGETHARSKPSDRPTPDSAGSAKTLAQLRQE